MQLHFLDLFLAFSHRLRLFSLVKLIKIHKTHVLVSTNLTKKKENRLAVSDISVVVVCVMA